MNIEHQAIVNILHKALGGVPNVQSLDSDNQSSTRKIWANNLTFDIVSLNDAPSAGVTTCATVGLSDYELRDNQNNKPPVRIELISVLKDDTDFTKLTEDASDKYMFYEQNLFYLACYIINENDYISYGDTWINFFTNKYQAMYEHSDMEHLFFMPQSLLTDKLVPTEIDDRKINWLLCVPISETELQYRDKHGSDALQELLIRNNIDVSDLFRESVV